MKRGWFLLLALSLGLNAGLLYRTLSAHDLSLPSRDAERGTAALDRSNPEDFAAQPAGVPIGGPPPGGAFPSGCPPCVDGPGSPGPCDLLLQNRMQRMASALDLDDTQQTEARAILAEMLPRILAERDRVQRIRVLLHDEYLQPRVAESRVRALVGELAAAQGRLDSLTAETILRESAVLGPDQRLSYFRSMPWERCRGCVPPPPKARRDRRLER